MRSGLRVPRELKRFEFIAYFVGAYVADVVLKSGRKTISPEEVAVIVDRALDNLRGRDGESPERSSTVGEHAFARQRARRRDEEPPPRVG